MNDLTGPHSAALNILSGEKSLHQQLSSEDSSQRHTDAKIETLENIIADKLRVISDLDTKLQHTRTKTTAVKYHSSQPAMRILSQPLPQMAPPVQALNDKKAKYKRLAKKYKSDL